MGKGALTVVNIQAQMKNIILSVLVIAFCVGLLMSWSALVLAAIWIAAGIAANVIMYRHLADWNSESVWQAARGDAQSIIVSSGFGILTACLSIWTPLPRFQKI